MIDVEDLISFNISASNLALSNVAFNSSTKPDTELINLYEDDKIRLTMANMTAHFSGEYSYCSDPPILADMGEIDFNFEWFKIIIDGYNYFEDNNLQVNLNNVSLEAKENPLHLFFDGLSDMGNVISRGLSYGGNTLVSRLVSIIKYRPPAAKLTKIVNALFRQIPDAFDIPGTNITVEGGIDAHAHSTRHGYLMLPLDLWF